MPPHTLTQQPLVRALLRQHGIRSLIFVQGISTSGSRYTKTFDTALPISEIPGPMKVPFVGNVFQIYKAGGIHKFSQAILTLQKEYGNIFQLNVGPERMVFISDPDMIEDVYRKEGKYPRREKTFPAWNNYHKKHNLPIGVFLEQVLPTISFSMQFACAVVMCSIT